MKKFGIDISDHQGNFNFEQAKNEGVEFVIIRASWGTNTDTKFERNVKECERLGIPYGVYCYSYALNDSDAIAEAKYILNLVKGKNLSYPIWYDMEDADKYKKKKGCNYSLTKSFCDKFCSTIESAGYYTGIYASKSWLDNYLTGLNKYDKWVAQWSNKCTYKGSYGMWQFTSDKIVSRQRIDCNYALKDYPSIINGGTSTPIPTQASLKVGDKVRICTAGHYNYYVADDVQKALGMYQVREDLNAGGETRFSWKDNGIPEKFVDIVNSNGKKKWNSDLIHMKKGYKFVFNRAFRISKTTTDGGIKYYQLDAGLGDKYKFWVIGDYLKLV